MVATAGKKKKKKEKKPTLTKGSVAEEKTEETLAFDCLPEDHCETPLVAYEDIAPALDWLFPSRRKSVRIYDPYYCAGSVVKKLNNLGFERVINNNVDCYSDWKLSENDVLVTNPPYSTDHMEKLAERCCREGVKQPWLWLVPEWTHKKKEVVSILGQRRPLFLSPTSRYVYEPPRHMREKTKSDTHKKTAPFHSIWIVWAGTQQRTDALASWWFQRKNSISSQLRPARSRSQLRDLRRRRPPPKPMQSR